MTSSDETNESFLFEPKYASNSYYRNTSNPVEPGNQICGWKYDDITELQSVLEITSGYCLPDKGLKPSPVNAKKLKQRILRSQVPMSSSAAAITGLPYCFKTSILNKVFRQSMIRPMSSIVTQKFFQTPRDRCLTAYNVSIFGEYPFNKFYWSPTTRRYNTVCFTYSDLLRTNVLRDIDVKDMEFHPFPETSVKMFDNDIINDHFKFVYNECKKLHTRIKDGELSKRVFQEGLSIAIGLDIGFNKALYDILPVFAVSCTKLVRFVFFSLERDGEDLSKPPDLNAQKYKDRPDHYQVLGERSRLTYILHHAAAGYDSKTQKGPRAVMVATIDDKTDRELQVTVKSKILKRAEELGIKDIFYEEWLYVNPNDSSSIQRLQEVAEKIIVHNNYFHMHVPLKWMFLRSLIASVSSKEPANLPMPSSSSEAGPVNKPHPQIIMSFNAICGFAKMLEMDEQNVISFLKTFTEFGSLLYCPIFEPLAQNVIVDIQCFMDLLDQLYHPKFHNDPHNLITQYGIVLNSVAKNILGPISNIFMDILISVGIATKLEKERYKIVDFSSLQQEAYYIPTAREGRLSPDDCSIGSAYIKKENEYVTHNAESILTQFILEQLGKATLIACTEFSCTRFSFAVDTSSVEVDIIYRGDTTELRLNDSIKEEVLISQSFVDTCTSVLRVCCAALNKKSTFIKEVHFNIGLQCHVSGKMYYHYLYYDKESDFCVHCQELNEKDQKRKCWINAAKMCELLTAKGPRRLRHVSLDQKFLATTAENLNRRSLNECQLKRLTEALGIDADDVNDYDGWKFFTVLFLMWEKERLKRKESCTKDNLIDIVKQTLDIDLAV